MIYTTRAAIHRVATTDLQASLALAEKRHAEATNVVEKRIHARHAAAVEVELARRAGKPLLDGRWAGEALA